MTNPTQTLRFVRWSVLGVLVALSAGCLRLKVDDQPPTAEIWVDGALKAKSGGSPATVMVPFSGTAVTVVLDGTHSSDSDGMVTSFRWLRTDIPAASRWADGGLPPPDSGLPAFQPSDDPGLVQQAQVTLGMGKYRYSLWVTDDEGAVSAPATVTLQVGDAPKAPAKFVPMPDATCSAAYTNPKKGCADCVCTPDAMGGCLDELNHCFNNPDAMFSMLCSAAAKCTVSKSCAGNACLTAPNPCMAELTAAATYMGGTIDACSMPAMSGMNPCAASAALTACTTAMTSMCASACQ